MGSHLFFGLTTMQISLKQMSFHVVSCFTCFTPLEASTDQAQNTRMADRGKELQLMNHLPLRRLTRLGALRIVLSLKQSRLEAQQIWTYVINMRHNISRQFHTFPRSSAFMSGFTVSLCFISIQMAQLIHSNCIPKLKLRLFYQPLPPA